MRTQTYHDINPARPMKGIQVKEHEMNFVRQIHGVEILDVITRYFYKDNNLCFQVLLHVDGGETIVYQEFNDYSEYIKTLNYLHEARSKDVVLKIPGKNIPSGDTSSKVA